MAVFAMKSVPGTGLRVGMAFNKILRPYISLVLGPCVISRALINAWIGPQLPRNSMCGVEVDGMGGKHQLVALRQEGNLER